MVIAAIISIYRLCISRVIITTFLFVFEPFVDNESRVIFLQKENEIIHIYACTNILYFSMGNITASLRICLKIFSDHVKLREKKNKKTAIVTHANRYVDRISALFIWKREIK